MCVCVCVCVSEGGKEGWDWWIARYLDGGWMNRMKGRRETGRKDGKKESEVPAPLGFGAVGVGIEGIISTFGGPNVPAKIMP